MASATVYLEDSPDAAQRARRAQEHLDAGRPGEAAALLQSVRVEFGARLMERQPGLYVDAARWVGQQLLSDPALHQAYRSRFDAEAQRARDQAHHDHDPAAALARVAQRYAGSGPGRDAALDLAARHVRAGRGVAAAAVLNEVAAVIEQPQAAPSAAERDAAARYWALAAWSAALRADRGARDGALAALAAQAGDDAAAALRAQLTPPATPGTAAGVTHAVDMGPAPRPLWRVTLALPETKPQDITRYGGYGAQRNTAPAPLEAVAHADLILANDTQRVYALDAVSGRLRWSHTPASDAADIDPNAAWRGGVTRTVPDKRSVAVDPAAPQRVFAITGPVQTLRGGRGAPPAPPASRLVCLDTARGDVVWTARPGDVDAVVAKASFHGTPLLTADLVIVAARRSQVASFNDSYLVAFDRRTGALRWRRHLASTPGPQQRRGGGELSSLSLDPATQRVYFCDNLGAAAALNAATGAVRWLRVFDDAKDDAPGSEPFALLAPGLAPAPVRGGVLLPVSQADHRGLLLDADTGHTRQTFSASSPLDQATAWQPLPDGDLLLVDSAGSVQRLSGDDLAARWAHAGQATATAVAGDRVWLIDETGNLTGLDLDSGATVGTATLTSPGALVPVVGGVVTVQDRSFASYTPWDAAYTTLKQRAAQNPDTPEIGLSMATLALNAAAEQSPRGDGTTAEAVLRGIDHVLHTLDTPDTEGVPERTTTRDALLSLTERAADTLSHAELTRVFDRLAGAARSPEELLSYTLARAVASARGDRPTQAADLYQTVLDNPDLAAGRVRRHGVTRRGGVVARQALQELIARAGPGVYAAHARRAAGALAELDRGPDANSPEPYLALAHRYPMGAAAAAALLRAGELQSAGSAPAAAATTLRRSYRLSVDDPARAAAAAALARHYLQHQRPAHAARWLTQVGRDGLTLPLDRGQGTPITADAWAAALQGGGAVAAAPRLALPVGSGISLPGRLMLPPEGRYRPDAGGRVLLRGPGPGVLTLVDAASPQTARWQIEEEVRDHTLVDLSTDTAVLWSPAAGHIIVRSVADGAALFAPVSAETLLSELGAGGRVAAARRLAAGASIELIEADFDRATAESRRVQSQLRADRTNPPHLAAGEAAVAFVDRVGRAAAFDRYSGTALWHLELPIESVQWTRVVDGRLLVGGLRGAGTGAEAGVVLVLDITTGQSHIPALEDPAPALWAGLDARANVLVLRADELSAHDPRTGAVRWRSAFTPLTGQPTVRVAGDRWAACDGPRLVAVDLASGTVTGQTAALPDETRLLAAGDRLVLDHGIAGMTALNPDAATAWHSAIHHERRGSIAATALDGGVLVATSTGDRRNPTVQLFRVQSVTGRITDRQLIDLPTGLLRPGPLTVIGGTLLFSDRRQTLFFPGTDAAGGD